MTEAEFCLALAALLPEHWSAHMSSLDAVVHLFYHDSDDIFCPLTAVALERTGRHFGYAEITPAAESLGLPLAFAHAVIAAADNDRSHDSALRARLLHALGLKERT